MAGNSLEDESPKVTAPDASGIKPSTRSFPVKNKDQARQLQWPELLLQTKNTYGLKKKKKHQPTINLEKGVLRDGIEIKGSSVSY